MSGDELLRVRLLGFPIALHEASQAHLDGLLREFRLLVERPTGVDVDLPQRLLQVTRDRAEAYASAGDVRDEQVEVAERAGMERVEEVVFLLPREVALASPALAVLLLEADAYCRAGRELSVLATPPDIMRYRAWYLGQLDDQAHGLEPVAWPG